MDAVQLDMFAELEKASDYRKQNWAVAVAFTVAAICTFAAWVGGLAICLMRWLNG